MDRARKGRAFVPEPFLTPGLCTPAKTLVRGRFMKLTRILAPRISQVLRVRPGMGGLLAQCMKQTCSSFIAHRGGRQDRRGGHRGRRRGSDSQGIRQNVVEERQKRLTDQYEMVVSREIKAALKVEQTVKIGVPFLEIVRWPRRGMWTSSCWAPMAAPVCPTR